MDPHSADRPPRGLRLVHSGSAPLGAPATRGSNAVLGIDLFIASEAMLFAALIVTYLALRAGAEQWPPPGQPRLPVIVTGLNTVVLLLSGLTVWRALRAARAFALLSSRRWLLVTAALGGVFLLVQGGEWVRLISYGLRMTGNPYGGIFYTVIGVHAVHVAIGVAVLGVASWRARRDPLAPARQVDIEVGARFWLFVVAVWPVLYGLVYVL